MDDELVKIYLQQRDVLPNTVMDFSNNSQIDGKGGSRAGEPRNEDQERLINQETEIFGQSYNYDFHQFLKTYRVDNTIYQEIKKNGINRPRRSNSDDNLGVESKNAASKALGGITGCLLNNSGDGLSDDSDDKDSFDFEIHEM